MFGPKFDVTLLEDPGVLDGVPVQDIVDVLDVVMWPIVALVALALVFSKNGDRFIQALQPRRVSGFGFELELSPEKATELRVGLEETFRDYRERARIEFARLTHKHRIEERLGQVAREAIQPVARSKFRCTVYVRDPLFADALYCLVDYYPGGRARGRTFSIRFGIIGRAWREEKSQLEPVVSNERDVLVHGWGMTVREADAAQQNASALMCVVLKDGDGDTVGVVFASADSEGFAKGDETTVEAHQATAQLAAAVAEVAASMRDREPAIRIFHH